MPKRESSTPLLPYWETSDRETVRLYQGDVLAVLKRLPSRSVHMVVTSPPYWGLRDYGTAEWEGGDPKCDHKRRKTDAPKDPTSTLSGRATNQNHEREPWPNGMCGKCGAQRIDSQLGSEKTPDEYISRMVEVFAEIRRILRRDGTVWLNIGDTYGGGTAGGCSPKSTLGGGGGRYREGSKNKAMYNSEPTSTGSTSLPSGNLVGVPWRLALALQADGWILRQDIIWAKPSPMPESVTNRCTKSHEYIFLLTPSMDYFYDAESLRDPHWYQREEYQDKYAAQIAQYKRRPSASKGSSETATVKYTGVYKDDRLSDNSAGRNKRSVWSVDDHRSLLDWLAANDPETLARFLEESRDKRDVWNVASYGYPGAHFATYPPKLIEPCIRAGTSEYGCCVECGAPWRRVVKRDRKATRPGRNTKVFHGGTKGTAPGQNLHSDARARRDGEEIGNRDELRHCTETETIGWEQTCGCDTEEVRPCVVLDPFLGSGTTAQVCLELGRYCVGIDLSEDYLRKNAVPRIEGVMLGIPALSRLIPSRRK